MAAFAIYQLFLVVTYGNNNISQYSAESDFQSIGTVSFDTMQFTPFLQIINQENHIPIEYDAEKYDKYFSINLQQVFWNSTYKPKFNFYDPTQKMSKAVVCNKEHLKNKPSVQQYLEHDNSKSLICFDDIDELEFKNDEHNRSDYKGVAMWIT